MYLIIISCTDNIDNIYTTYWLAVNIIIDFIINSCLVLKICSRPNVIINKI